MIGKSSLIATTVSANCLAILGFASSAFAYFVPDMTESEVLVEALAEVGGSFAMEDELCDEYPVLGFARRETREVVACVMNHQGNISEFHDTIRHEVVHVAQGCKATREGKKYVPLREDLAIFYQGYAEDYLGWNRLGYNMEQWTTEAEARVLAEVMDQYAIVGLLLEECTHGS